YLLSGLYWLSGWTVLVYMAFPLVRILFGVQPLAHLTAPEFLLHFAPYFAVALSTAALAGTGAYTFAALALAASTFWLHIVASMLTAAGRKGSFKVTPKQGAAGRQSPAAGASAIGAGREFLERYTAPDGRVRRLDQGDDTVSEGQAYGLLVAAALDDTGRFDAIWGWTRRHLRRSDGLLASHWQRGRVVDPQAATDADLDAARALLVARC